MPRGEIYSWNILPAICHEHIKCTAYPRSEKNGRADYMDVFNSEVVHGVLAVYSVVVWSSMIERSIVYNHKGNVCFVYDVISTDED